MCSFTRQIYWKGKYYLGAYKHRVFSIVEKTWNKPDDTLTIRARVYDDLVRLKAYLPSMSDIISSEDSDYRYRSVADREAVMAAMSMLTAEIQYDNFKDEVARSDHQGYARAALYGEVWQVLYRLQSSRFDQQPAPPTML